MTIEDGDIDPKDLQARGGNDSTPLISLVHDKHYSRGGLTSESRTASSSYQAFVRRAQKEFKHVRK